MVTCWKAFKWSALVFKPAVIPQRWGPLPNNWIYYKQSLPLENLSCSDIGHYWMLFENKPCSAPPPSKPRCVVLEQGIKREM